MHIVCWLGLLPRGALLNILLFRVKNISVLSAWIMMIFILWEYYIIQFTALRTIFISLNYHLTCIALIIFSKLDYVPPCRFNLKNHLIIYEACSSFLKEFKTFCYKLTIHPLIHVLTHQYLSVFILLYLHMVISFISGRHFLSFSFKGVC